jgi:hypothetical protein
LPQLVLTSGALGLGFGPGERRQEQCGQYPNDGDDDQEFEQREGVLEVKSIYVEETKLESAWRLLR